MLSPRSAIGEHHLPTSVRRGIPYRDSPKYSKALFFLVVTALGHVDRRKPFFSGFVNKAKIIGEPHGHGRLINNAKDILWIRK
jgi:hypothetical protein